MVRERHLLSFLKFIEGHRKIFLPILGFSFGALSILFIRFPVFFRMGSLLFFVPVIDEENGEKLSTQLKIRKTGHSSDYYLEYMHPKRGKRKIFVAATPFTDHNGVIHGSIGFLTDVTDNEKKKAHIEALSRRNDYLVAEMQHRIGNSLAVLKAFLNFYLSAKKINGRDGLEKLDDIIDTMSYIYMAFSRNFTVQTIMLPDYFQGITWDLIHKYRCNLRPIVAGRENFEIHIDRALPLGFLYTILISNIIKKASKAGTEGSLSIKLDTVEDKNKTVIEIALLGTTGKEAMFIHKTKSFEKEIVATLLSQIRGKMLTEKGKGKIRLEF
jgi:two-component sensor histidine kinase